jgi:hypothetical protein
MAPEADAPRRGWSFRLLPVLVALALIGGGGAVGCTTSCGAVDCSGSNLTIWWDPGDLPTGDGVGYRVCADGACEPAVASLYGTRVTVIAQVEDDGSVITLQVVDAAGAASQEFSGVARLRSGGCCGRQASLRVEPGGSLVEERLPATAATSTTVPFTPYAPPVSPATTA